MCVLELEVEDDVRCLERADHSVAVPDSVWHCHSRVFCEKFAVEGDRLRYRFQCLPLRALQLFKRVGEGHEACPSPQPYAAFRLAAGPGWHAWAATPARPLMRYRR